MIRGWSSCRRLKARSWWRELRRAAARLPDLLDVVPAGVVRRQVVEHHLAVAEDRAQQIVEVVGDAAGQPAHRFHLLGLAELLLRLPERFLGRAHQLLGRPALGHVALGAPDRRQEAVLDHAEQVVDEPALPAVPVELAGLELDGPVPAADEGAEELQAPGVGQIERCGELRARAAPSRRRSRTSGPSTR